LKTTLWCLWRLVWSLYRRRRVVALITVNKRELSMERELLLRLVVVVLMLLPFWPTDVVYGTPIDCTTASPPLSPSLGVFIGSGTVTLTLTAGGTCAAMDPQQVLTGVGFNYSGPLLTPGTATVGSGTGSVVAGLYDVSSGVLSSSSRVGGPGTDVGNQWGFSLASTSTGTMRASAVQALGSSVK